MLHYQLLSVVRYLARNRQCLVGWHEQHHVVAADAQYLKWMD
jgi:hypothetical protein